MNNTKEKEKDNRNNRIILLILGVATVLIALIGATFAYFTSVIRYNNAPQSVTLTTVQVQGLEYTASDTLSLVDAIPNNNKTDTQTFTIYNPNATAVITYDMFLKTDLNEFTITEYDSDDDGEDEEFANQLIVTITGGQSGTVVLDLTDGTNTADKTIVENVRLAGHETDEYTATIKFADINIPQDNNQGCTYVGHIDVVQRIEAQATD